MEINKRYPRYHKIDGVLKCIMRTIILLFCVATFGLTPKEGMSQRITIDADKTVSVEEVFRIIKSQTTDYMFIYHEGLLRDLPKVELKKGTIRMDKLINKSLFAADLNVVVTKNNTILIKERQNREQQQIKGTVTDIDGVPLQGVNVLLKGTTRGTLTDSNGVYTIQVFDGEQVLVFSYLGFKSQEITVGNQSNIVVKLEEDVSALEEVVLNAGYYTVSERESTGSISKVTAVNIEKQPVSNPLAAMQGRMSGVDIVQQTGIPGGNFRVQIRGTNSVRLDVATANDPLYIIDGIPMSSASLASNTTSTEILAQGVSPLGGINPNNIESIEVLKDADATAIYGSRGANGVVLITTKRGKEGKTRVEVDLSTGLGVVSNKVEMMDTEQYLAMRREAITNDGREPGSRDYDINGTWDESRYTDWQEELIGGTAYTTNAHVSISGGSSQTSFMVSGAHRKETTAFIGDHSYVRNSAHLNLNHKTMDDKLHLNGSVNVATIKNNLPGANLTGFALALPPNAPMLYDAEGNLNWENSTWTNPLSRLEREYNSEIHQLFGNLSLTYELVQGLKLKLNSGYSRTTTKEINTTPKSYYDPAYGNSVTNHAYFSNSDLIGWIAEPQLQYNTSLGVDNLDILIGSSFQHQDQNWISQLGTGFSSDALIKDLASATSVEIASNSISNYRYHAIFGRINYSFNGKYIVNLTGRRDASSRFGPGKQWGNFGAVGMAWLFSEEGFFGTRGGLLSFGKLKLSYGTTGNDKIGDYGYLDTYAATDSYQGQSGLAPVRLFNPDFGWEVNRKAEMGLDLGFFNDALSISTGYYHNISTNQLVGMPLPPTTGFGSVQSNMPAKVRNTGLEFTLNSRNIVSDNFSWTTGFNVTVPRSKLVDFPNLEGSTYEMYYQVGEPLQIRKVYRSLGVDPETGIYRFDDLNEDGVLNADDRIALFAGQNYFGGLSNTIKHKGFQLDFHFQFVKQYGNTMVSTLGLPSGFNANQPITVLDRWRKPGDVATYQRYSSTFSQAALTYFDWTSSTASEGDASFIRLKNISLAYQLPNEIAQKLAMTGIQCYLRGQNLFTITDYDGLDPEIYASGVTLPPLRTITVGATLSF